VKWAHFNFSREGSTITFNYRDELVFPVWKGLVVKKFIDHLQVKVYIRHCDYFRCGVLTIRWSTETYRVKSKLFFAGVLVKTKRRSFRKSERCLLQSNKPRLVLSLQKIHWEMGVFCFFFSLSLSWTESDFHVEIF